MNDKDAAMSDEEKVEAIRAQLTALQKRSRTIALSQVKIEQWLLQVLAAYDGAESRIRELNEADRQLKIIDRQVALAKAEAVLKGKEKP